MKSISVQSFDQWRDTARHLLSQDIPPADVKWTASDEPGLFDAVDTTIAPTASVPKAFVDLARAVSCHRDHKKWTVLYRLLWRLCKQDKNLLQIATDTDVRQAMAMRKDVSRDSHKMKAFVRFRKLADKDVYIAWHEPSHLIVEYTAPFFARRFKAMVWGILTPDQSAWWDGSSLTFHAGVPRSKEIEHDDLEDLWLTFYENIFNPARIKTKMMRSEMPVKYWHTMPETALITKMLADAPKRVEAMMDAMRGSE